MRLLNLVSFSLRLKSFLLVKEIVTKDICKAIEYETEKKKQFEHRRTVYMEKNSTRFIIRRIAKHECKFSLVSDPAIFHFRFHLLPKHDRLLVTRYLIHQLRIYTPVYTLYTRVFTYANS